MSLNLSNKRWVYWLDKTRPENDTRETFRVSVVVENESGHYPTGGGPNDPMKAPWYWDDETCRLKNAERGYTVEECWDIVNSSMCAKAVELR